MERQRRLPVMFALVAALASACGDAGSAPPGSSASARPTSAPPSATPPASTPAATTAPPAIASAAVSSKPLASNAIEIPGTEIALEPPAGTTGTAQAAGRDVIVRFPGKEVSLTISSGHGDLAHEKDRTKGEKGFVKWALETDHSAIAEVEVDKAHEYVGFTVKELGGTAYECSTLTMKRPTSPNLQAVKDSLALCDGLRAK